MKKVVKFSKKSVKYTLAIVNWLIYSIVVGGTTVPVNATLVISGIFLVYFFLYT